MVNSEEGKEEGEKEGVRRRKRWGGREGKGGVGGKREVIGGDGKEIDV